MNCRILDTILIPVLEPNYPGIREIIRSGQPYLPRECAFSIRVGFLSSEVFYECCGCTGAGLRCFSRGLGEIPEDVWESMRTHAQLCEGMFPSIPSVATSR